MKSWLIVRRIHMYLALFLTPWMLLYGLSTLFMNHMPFFRSLYGQNWGRFVVAQELSYADTLPEGAKADPDPKAVAPLLLEKLGMTGAHGVQTRPGGSGFVIHRNAAISPRRVIATPASDRLVVERREFQLPLVLFGLHARHGYAQPYLANDLWAFAVDLVIVAMLLWGVTGLWMWNKMKRARRWGAVCVVTSCVVFAFFVLAI